MRLLESNSAAGNAVAARSISAWCGTKALHPTMSRRSAGDLDRALAAPSGSPQSPQGSLNAAWADSSGAGRREETVPSPSLTVHAANCASLPYPLRMVACWPEATLLPSARSLFPREYFLRPARSRSTTNVLGFEFSRRAPGEMCSRIGAQSHWGFPPDTVKRLS